MPSRAVSSPRPVSNGESGMTTTLILGGARSGKSAYAEKLAAASGKEIVYIATATAHDPEMHARIAHHRHTRPISWITVEEPYELAAAIRRWIGPKRLILVDCLTLWLTNILFTGPSIQGPEDAILLPPAYERQRTELLDTILELGQSGSTNDRITNSELLLVSNEVGMGIVPLGAMSRRFVDESGWLHQEIAARCDRAVLVVAGLPMTLKESAC